MPIENAFLIHAFVLGVFITFVYDLLRIFRRIVPHSNLWISIEDLGFWGFCGIQVFMLMYHESNGTLRWFAVLGALLGMLGYKITISGTFVKYASLGIRKVVEVIAKIFNFLFKPIVFVGRKAKKAAFKMERGRRSVNHYIKNRLTQVWKTLKIGLSKQ